METQVYVIGVHGSQVVGISSLQDVCGLSRDDINHISPSHNRGGRLDHLAPLGGLIATRQVPFASPERNKQSLNAWSALVVGLPRVVGRKETKCGLQLAH